MSNRNKILTQVGSVAALCFMFIAFQNCGKRMEFSSDSLGKAALVEVPLDDGVNDNDNSADDSVDSSGDVADDSTDSSDDSSGDVADDSSDSSDDSSDDVADDSPGNSNNSNSSNDNNSGGNTEIGEPDDDDDENSGPRHFICILEGSGKSQKLALVEDALLAQTSAVHTVCTTERGCLDIASQKFEVKSAEFRGYCKNGGADSVSLSEDQLQSVIDNTDNSN